MTQTTLSTGRSRRGFAIALGVVAIAALGVRIAFIVLVDPHVPFLSDAGAYHRLANDLAAGRGYIRPFDHLLLHKDRATAEYPPLFPGVLSVASLLGAKTVHAQRIFLAFIGTGTVVGIGLLGRKLAGDAAGLVAAALAAFYPMLFQSDAALMSETLFVFLVTIALVLAYRAADAPSPGRFALLGAVLGVAALTRTEGLLLAVVLVVPLALTLDAAALSRRVTLVVVGLVATAAVVTPWTIRNAVALHAFVPISTNVGTAIDGANCDLTYYGPQLGSWRSTFGARPASSSACFEGFDVRRADFDEAAAATTHRDEGLRYTRHHLRRLVTAVMPARFMRTWGLWHVDQQIDLATLEGRTTRWETIGTWMYWCLLPLAAVGVLVLAYRHVRVWPLLATAVAVAIATVLTYGNQRFRVAAEPAIVVAAAVTLVAVARVVPRRDRAGAHR